MRKSTHKSVKFTAAEMAEDVPPETDFNKMRYLGRGQQGMEMARRISQARGEEKRKLIASLPRGDQVESSSVEVVLDPDVAAVFKNADTVNKALRAFIAAIPQLAPQKQTAEPRRKKTA